MTPEQIKQQAFVDWLSMRWGPGAVITPATHSAEMRAFDFVGSAATAAERERCAKVVNELPYKGVNDYWREYDTTSEERIAFSHADACVAAISEGSQR